MKSFRKHRIAAMSAAAITALLGASSASALDYDGYFRVGPGLTSKNNARACYNLGITGGHYRLGNECDFYGEFGLAQVGNVDGVTYKAKVMFNEYNPGTNIGSSSSSFEQMYVEAKGYDIAPDSTFWIGKRFFGRADVHILDKFFVNLSGVGAGFDLAAAGGRLAFAYFSSDNGGGGVGGNDTTNNGGGVGTATNPGNRLNIDLTDVPVNPGGKLRVTGTFTNGRFDNPTDGKGTNGFGLSLQHNQTIAGLGENTLWLQYAQGSAGLDGNFGEMTAQSSVKQMTVVESLVWQVGTFGGQAVALYGSHDKNDLTGAAKYSWISVGGRASLALSKNFKLLAEYGHMEKKPDGSPTQKLDKFTFAPTLTTGAGFWNRPELRLYVTTAKWNNAARDAGGSVNGVTGLVNDKTSGTSFGLQAEVWF